MCMFCDWDDGELFGPEAVEDPAAAIERRRASQDSWDRLMAQIAQTDAQRAGSAPAQDDGG